MKSLTKIVGAAVLAMGIGFASACDEEMHDPDSGMYDDGCELPPKPAIDSYSLEMECLETREIYFNGMENSEGCGIDMTIEDDWHPFSAVLMKDGLECSSGLCDSIRITAPDHVMMPDSPYATSAVRSIRVGNYAGESQIHFDIQMKYGCEMSYPEMEQTPEGLFFETKLVSSRYSHNTYLAGYPARTIRIFARGTVCENINDPATCHGPEPSSANPYGLIAKIDDTYYSVGRFAEITHEGEFNDLILILPFPEGTVFDTGIDNFEDNCQDPLLINRTGLYSVGINLSDI